MKILFFVPHLNTIYAGRTIYNGYKNAFLDLGHEFKFLTADHNQSDVYRSYKPDILFTSIGPYFLKFLDLNALKDAKKSGMRVFVNTPFWNSPMSVLRVNESSSLSVNTYVIDLIKSGELGDIYYNSCEPGDLRMKGFKDVTGYDVFTVPLAADKTSNFFETDHRFACDISFLGTNLPGKRKFFKQVIFPLRSKFDVKFFGQDWTFADTMLGYMQKAGQYFNVPILKSIQKPKLALEDEHKIYSSAKISINIHEDYQLEYGGDCNERTFKILACSGFEICDDVKCISKYFKEGKEIIIARSKEDWLEKLDYYVNNEAERKKISSAGRSKVLQFHTYHNRVNYLLDVYNNL